MIERSVKNGVQLAVVVLVVCVIGVTAALRVPVQMIPDLEIRTITVRTIWPGATPQDVEKEILIQQEDYLRNVTGLTRMIATARTGQALIELDFPFGTDINDAMVRVNNALSQVPNYPENVDEPRLFASSFSQNPFMFFRIVPLPGHPIELDLVRLRDFVEDHVEPRMERVPGISNIWIGSGERRQVQIRVDPNRLAATGVSLTELRDAVRARNVDFSAGDIDSGKRRYLLRTVGRFEDYRDLEDLIVARRGDSIVRLRDLAEISLEHFELRAMSFTDGAPTISVSVIRELGSNVIEIKDALMPVAAALNRDVLNPAGLHMRLISDDVRYVQSSVANVWRNLLIGAALATLIMYIFLRSVPATVIGVIGVPVCTIAAFIGLMAAGRTINVISLAGVAFAIGMTLDNSIVALESIERYRRQGMDRFAAALAGVRRVWPAILASSLTTVLVFAPILFIVEEAGQLFSDIAIAISASIVASMLVAMTVVPSASARVVLSPNDKAGLAVRFGAAFKRGVIAAVGWLVGSRLRSIMAAGAIIAMAGGVILYLTPPAEYLPEGEEAKTFSVMIAPAGYNLTEMAAIARRLNTEISPHVDADPGAFERGETDIPPIMWLVTQVNSQRIFMVSETVNPAHIDALRAALNTRFREYPGMRGFSSRGSIISSNDGGSRSVNLDISGADLPTIYAVANAAYRRAGEVFEEPEIDSDPRSLALAQPLIELRPNWTRAAELGMTSRELGFAIAALTDGAYVDELILDGDRVDVFLYSTLGSEQTLANLPILPLTTPEEGIVPIGSVVDLVERVDTDEIRRLDGRRTVTLNIIPPRTVALESAVGIVQEEVVGHLRRTGAVPAGVTLDISGASDQLQRTRSALIGNGVVAVILCYLLLAAIFSHWALPFIIMTTVPLGIAGGIVGLWLLNAAGAALPVLGLAAVHQPFDMITMLGFVILLGTVVNNPILIVDQAVRLMRDEDIAPETAVVRSVETRLRPMMMATTTTVFGIAPLVLIPGAGTELYRGVGAIVLFGLLFATFVTILFLPPVLTLVLRAAGWLRQRRGQAPQDAPAAKPTLVADTEPLRRDAG